MTDDRISVVLPEESPVGLYRRVAPCHLLEVDAQGACSEKEEMLEGLFTMPSGGTL